MLDPGSVILPGNWGRIIRAAGWRHNSALAEQSLEAARKANFDDLPSRLDCAFGFVTEQEARDFRKGNNAFGNHLLYRVTLVDPAAPSHITDSRLCVPQGAFRHDWADAYWLGVDGTGQPASPIPGIDWSTATSGVQLRELLTLSGLRVEERLN